MHRATGYQLPRPTATSQISAVAIVENSEMEQAVRQLFFIESRLTDLYPVDPGLAMSLICH